MLEILLQGPNFSLKSCAIVCNTPDNMMVIHNVVVFTLVIFAVLLCVITNDTFTMRERKDEGAGGGGGQ